MPIRKEQPGAIDRWAFEQLMGPEPAAPAPAPIAVTVLGPNLSGAHQRKGYLHVHRAGCADIWRQYGYLAVDGAIGVDETVSNLAELVTSWYPPGDFDYDDDDPAQVQRYGDEFWLAPCVTDLPEA